MKAYTYPSVTSSDFANPATEAFHYNTEAISHTRNLTFLKPLLGGPFFDLEAIWDEHTRYEFAERSVEHTMSTMVEQPYVNHVPTVSLTNPSPSLCELTVVVYPQMTGGIGRASLTEFYRHHFIFNNSADTELELISRTVGIDRVVDEFIFKFTHDKEIDWM